MKTLLSISLAFFVLLHYSCNNSKTTATITQVNNSAAVMVVHNPAGRVAESFDDLKAQGIRISQLDSAYPSGVNVDTNKAVFNGRMSQFVGAYRNMINAMGDSLFKNDSLKHKKFRFFNRVYFEANGTIDYYLYSHVTGLTAEEEVLFKKSLNEFVATYQFPMTAKTPFAQCSPVNVEP